MATTQQTNCPATNIQRDGSRTAARNASSARVVFLLLCGLGVALSAELTRLHVKVYTTPGFESYCSISKGWDCHTVALSPYSVFLGLPLSIWGLLGYLLMGALAAWGLRAPNRASSHPFGILTLLAAFCALLSVGLFWLSRAVIGSSCLLCAGTYAVNFLLAGLAWFEVRAAGSTPFRALASDLELLKKRPRPLLWAGGSALLSTIILQVAVPSYWRADAATLGIPLSSSTAQAAATGQTGAARAAATRLHSGITADGHPWIGAAEPALVVVEYSDYQCPFCRQGHAALRALVEAEPDRLRLEHRHFPLDDACNPAVSKPFHANACLYARMAFCAQAQGDFWAANDLLFARGRDRVPVDVKEFAEALELDEAALRVCVESEDSAAAIVADLDSAQALGIDATPTYVLGDEVYVGRISPQIVLEAMAAGQNDPKDPAWNLGATDLQSGHFAEAEPGQCKASEGGAKGGLDPCLEGETQWLDPAQPCGDGSMARDRQPACGPTEDAWQQMNN